MGHFEEYRRFLKTDAWRELGAAGHESDQRKGLPMPPVQKPYSLDAKLVDLIAPEDLTIGDVPVREAIGRRRSRRRYAKDPLTLEELSFLLWATQGVSQLHQTPDGIITTRTVPSAGARHAFETYLLINRVEGVPFGLYRYLPLEHKLLFMRADEDLPEKVTEGCCGQTFVGRAPVVFIWTAIPYRMEWRYSVVAHKLIAVDVGHVCQNLYIAAEAIGCGTCAIGAYLQAEMDAVLGVDGSDEFVIYAAPVGKVEE